MSDYTLTQREYSNLKRLLTIARKRGTDATIAECRHAMAVFAEKGYPDSWSNWERAYSDALLQQNRESRDWLR